jgi:hypothetical protein
MSVKCDGKPFVIGGRELIVPPLSVALARKHRDIIDALGAKSQFDTLLDMSVLIHAALARNYDDVSLEFVQEWVDFGNCAALMQALFGQALQPGNGPAGPGPAQIGNG